MDRPRMEKRLPPMLISRRLLEALDRMAADRGLSRADVIREALMEKARQAGEL